TGAENEGRSSFHTYSLFRANIVRSVSIFADELDQLGIEHDSLIDLHRKRLRIRLWIINGNFDFESSIVRPPEFLDDLSFVGQWIAIDVEPDAVNESGGFDHQCVAFPLSYRVAIPERLRIVIRQRPPIGKYLPQ